MVINDRLTRGFISGIVAGIAQSVVDYITFALKLNDIRYLDWTSTIIYYRKPLNLFETLFALGAVIAFSGILGIIFAYLIPQVTSKNFYFKGWLYGVTVWFTMYTVMVFFKVKGLEAIELDTAISDLFTSSIYGIVLSFMSKLLRTKQRVYRIT